MLSLFSCVRLCWTQWTVAPQSPLSMGCSRQEHWSGLPCPPPGDLPNPGIEHKSLMSPALAGGFLTTSTMWEAQRCLFILGVPRLNIVCFLFGNSCLLPGFIIYPMYLTCCFEICAFVLETEMLTMGLKEIRTYVVFWSMASIEGLHINILSTYSRMASSFRCIFFSSFPRAWVNNCRLTWNPWGNTVQVYYCIWLESGVSPLKGKQILCWGMNWMQKKASLRLSTVNHLVFSEILINIVIRIGHEGMYRDHCCLQL